MDTPCALRPYRYPAAAALCAATMLAALPFRGRVDVANIDMLFLLVVFVAAVWLGRGPAVLAAFLGVALFDFFFVPPYLSFAVADAQYLITFAVMLAVGLITSHLVATLAERTAQAQESERRTRLLHALGRDLGVALDVGQAARVAAAFADAFDLDALLLVSEEGELHAVGGRRLTPLEMGFARSAFERNAVVETDTLAGVSTAVAFIPLAVSTRVLGVLAVGPRGDSAERLRELRPALEAAAAQTALILERLAQAEAVRRSELRASEERLRSSILAALSHDLRTPLTSLVGLADALAQRRALSAEDAAETAGVIRDQALSMHHMLSNLLEMARLQAREVRLNQEWQPIDEVIGSSARLLSAALAGRTLDIDLPPGLPLVRFDAVLVERVVCNLLENAIKYSAPGSAIRVEAAVSGSELEVSVANRGDGFAPESIERVFEPFVRGAPEAATPGTGIGLAICKSIVAAHGGAIAAENVPGGARVRFTLPLGTPPALAEEAGS